jgi:integrase
VLNSRKAAEEYAALVEVMLKLGRVEDVFTEPASPQAPPPPTLKEIAERWWAVDGANFKGRTRDTYANILKTRILPVFGVRIITETSVPDVENWWAALRATRQSRKYTANMRTRPTSIFRRAVPSGIFARNPAEASRGRMGREDQEVRQVEWLIDSELTRSLAIAGQREPRYYPSLLTLATTRMRAGEALALQAGAVDGTRCRIAHHRTLRKHKLGSPKSGKARTVDVPPCGGGVAGLDRHNPGGIPAWFEAGAHHQEATGG